VRRARRLNQRELAATTGVARATIERIEAGGHSPSLATLERILAATQFSLAVVDADRAPLPLDDEHDAIHDRAGRRFPAHLAWAVVTEHDYEHWWAWYRYVPGTGMTRLMPLPPATFRRRTDPRSFKAYVYRLILGARRERDGQTASDP
jgi:transcriptional regulator with XRE-family HTH domain